MPTFVVPFLACAVIEGTLFVRRDAPTLHPATLLTLRGGSIAESDFSASARVLFDNMRVPAALVAGAVIPMGYAAAPQFVDGKDGSVRRLAVVAHALLTMATLATELITIVWATISVNKLTEVEYAPTESVMALLQRDFEMAWTGCNVHFLAGLFTLAMLTGVRSFISYGQRIGVIAMLSSVSAITLMTSVVNSGISQGDGIADGVRFGATVADLVRRYVSLLFSHAWRGPRPLVLCSLCFAATAFALAAVEIHDQVRAIRERRLYSSLQG
jgi:hypothetical protein